MPRLQEGICSFDAGPVILGLGADGLRSDHSAGLGQHSADFRRGLWAGPVLVPQLGQLPQFFRVRRLVEFEVVDSLVGYK